MFNGKPSRRILQLILVLIPLVLVAVQWMFSEVDNNNLLYKVPIVSLLPMLESKHTYLLLHIFTFFPVFFLSFDRNIHYYRKWKFLFPAILIVAFVFILWDVVFTRLGVWGFNNSYFLGIEILYLPMEEWLFFITVPFACVFIYECLNFYIPIPFLEQIEKWVTPVLIFLFIGIGLLTFGRLYTSSTFLLTGFFLLYHYLFLEASYRGRFYFSYLIILIPFFVINGILTGGYTQEPVVIYNPEEYLGIRVTSVPLDDAIYGLLLIFSIITIFESFRKVQA